MLLAWLLAQCRPADSTAPQTDTMNVVIAYPNIPGLPAQIVPNDNQPTRNRIALGKALFNDPILSLDNTVSCGSCHKVNLAMTEGKPLAVGIEGRVGTRNSPTLANIGYHSTLFWDGGVTRLESQVVAPIENPLEMDLPHQVALQRLAGSDRYRNWFRTAYGVATPDLNTLQRAIAAYERSLVTANSPADRFDQGDQTALSNLAKEGRRLFFSDSLNCAACHTPPLYTDLKFHNIGLYLNYADEGRQRVTVTPIDNGKFKTPTLRNIGVTQPFMHNGSQPDLDAVIRFKETGGQNHPRKSSLVKKFTLTNNQRDQLKAFLLSLTDQAFITQ